MEINPANLGSLDMGGMWAPYVDLVDLDFLPTRLRLGADEYAWESSILILGHGATLPAHIRDLRANGKKTLIAEREDRYYVYVSPP
jgi:hypothetical protein